MPGSARRCSRCHPARCHVARLPRHGSYERFATLAAETFGQVSDRTGIPLELLMVIREAIGIEGVHGLLPTWLERLLDADAIRTEAEALVPLAETR